MNNTLSNITNYEIMKKHLTMKLVPAERLKCYEGINYPVRKWFDLYIVPSVVWEETFRGQIGSMDVSFEIAESWGVDVSTIFQDAMENLERKTEYMVLEDALEELIERNADSDDPEIREILDNYDPLADRCPIYLLTNKARFYGASALLNVSAMTDIAKHCNSNLIIIPSSIHEVLLIPLSVFGDRTLEDITRTLSGYIVTVNEKAVHPEDRLSNHPYMFGRDYFGEWSYTSLEMAEWEDENE